MSKKDTDFQVNETCVVCENGGEARCRIVSMNPDNDGLINMELMILELIKPSVLMPSGYDPMSLVGRVLLFVKHPDLPAEDGWSLKDDPTVFH